MARITINDISDDVVRYREIVAAIRRWDKRELDTAVWREYMERHPIEKEPNYQKMKNILDQADDEAILAEGDENRHDRKEPAA